MKLLSSLLFLKKKKKKKEPGNSLAIQWLGLVTLTAWVQSLVGEEKFHKTRHRERKNRMRPWRVRGGVWGLAPFCSVVLKTQSDPLN